MQFWFGAMFPVPDRGLSDSDDLCDFSLEQTEIHAPFADVVTDGLGIGGVAGERLLFEGNFD